MGYLASASRSLWRWVSTATSAAIPYTASSRPAVEGFRKTERADGRNHPPFPRLGGWESRFASAFTHHRERLVTQQPKMPVERVLAFQEGEHRRAPRRQFGHGDTQPHVAARVLHAGQERLACIFLSPRRQVNFRKIQV